MIFSVVSSEGRFTPWTMKLDCGRLSFSMVQLDGPPSMVLFLKKSIHKVFRLIFLLGLYRFSYMLVKHVVNNQTLILPREWDKIAMLSLVFENMGHRERNTWSQEQICKSE